MIPITLNSRDPRPIYLQVKESLRQLIISGVLTPESKLPSVREIAGTLAINPNTIQRAYRELEAEGYIVSVPGKGSFVAERGEADSVRREELLGRFRTLLPELRQIGTAKATLVNLIEEEYNV